MNKKIIILIKIIFICFELFFLGTYLFPDIFNFGLNIDDSLVLFIIIILVFVSSFIYFKSWTKHEVIIRIGFLFTLIADFLMTYLDAYYELSICFFFLVQLSYFILINLLTKKQYLKSSLIVYGIVVSIVLIIGLFVYPLGLLEVLAIVYISLYFINILYLIRIKDKNRFLYCFLIGLILFFICDICIGLSNFNLQNKELEDFIYFMIWASYGPSQIILVNTLVGIKEKGGEFYEESIKS